MLRESAQKSNASRIIAELDKNKEKFSFCLGEISQDVLNLINRNFHAEIPNKLWLTDIAEFHIPADFICLRL